MKKLIFFGVLLASGAAAALSPTDDLRVALESCRALVSPDERLTCYDKSVERFVLHDRTADAQSTATGGSAEAAMETQAADPADAPQATPEWAQAPSPPVLRADPGPQEFTGVVVRIVRTSAGRHLFFLEDGSVWEQTQDVRVRLPASLPAQVELRSRRTGNPIMSFEGFRAGYRVRRIE